MSGNNQNHRTQACHVFDYQHANKIYGIYKLRKCILFSRIWNFYRTKFLFVKLMVLSPNSFAFTGPHNYCCVFWTGAVALTRTLPSAQPLSTHCYVCRRCCHYVMDRTLIPILTVSFLVGYCNSKFLCSLFSHFVCELLNNQVYCIISNNNEWACARCL